MDAPDGSAVFRPVVPNEAVATLLLIENSQEMFSMWPNLRDQYLPTLIGNMRIANPVAPIKILMLTSSPVDEPTAITSTSREYYEIPDVPFSFRSDNKISTATISKGIDLLAATGRGEPTARHVVIVAASTPTSDAIPGIANVSLSPRYGWHVLAQKLTQAEIRCHMILNPNQNMSAFTELFYETLRLGNFEEVAPWFQADENYLFHLSAPRSMDHVMTNTSGSAATCTDAHRHLSLQCNYAFPPDMHSGLLDDLPASAPMTSESPGDVAAPSLVARLQQAHGLTKKKIYGVKPNRRPFFRDEQVRETYSRTPTPLTIPSPPSTSTGSLVHRSPPSRAKIDRRLSDTSLSRTRNIPPYPLRGSRLSSPETDVSLPSSAPVSTYGISPVLPSYTDFEQFSSTQASPITPSATDSYLSDATVGLGSLRPIDPKIRTAEPAWLESQYHSGVPPLSPTSLVPMPFPGEGITIPDSPNNPQVRTHLSPHSLGLPSFKAPLVPSPVMGSIYPTGGRKPSLSPGDLIPSLSLATSSMDDGNQPFIFNPDDDSAIQPPLEGIFQSTYRYPIPPSTERGAALAPLSSDAEEAYRSTARSTQITSSAASTSLQAYHRNAIFSHSNKVARYDETRVPPHDDMSIHGPGGSSSLTGWAG